MTNSPKLQSTSSNNEDYIVGGKTMGGKTNSGEVPMIFRARQYRAIPRSKPPKHAGQDFLNCENCHFFNQNIMDRSFIWETCYLQSITANRNQHWHELNFENFSPKFCLWIEFRFFNPVIVFPRQGDQHKISTCQRELSCPSHLAQPVGSLFCYILAVKYVSSKYLNCDPCWYMLHCVRRSPPFLFRAFEQ